MYVKPSAPWSAIPSAVAGFAIQFVSVCAAKCALGFLGKAEFPCIYPPMWHYNTMLCNFSLDSLRLGLKPASP